MATAKEEREAVLRGEGILCKAADDEPVFIFRAQDLFALLGIAQWQGLLRAKTGNTPKVQEAERLMNAMMAWQDANPDKVKVPD